MKKLTQQNIAFLVLDHTNSEGELQGTHVKRRAMDLGLKLELCEENRIDITCQADRYGVAQLVEPLSFVKCFTSSEFILDFSHSQKHRATEGSHEVQDDVLNSLSADDTRLMVIYILHLQGKKSKEVAEILGKNKALLAKF